MEFGNYPSIVDVVVDSKLEYFKNSFATLKQQTVQDFELLLVVGWPGDAVREFVREQDYAFNLVLIQEPKRDGYPARASANNMGLDAATGNIYIGTQDDILFPKNWIEKHIDWQKRPGGPWFVFNRIANALTSDRTPQGEEEFWGHISNPRNVPIVSRWQYASGHSFSIPMAIAKSLRHEELFNKRWGFEDIYWSYLCFKAGCRFLIDTDTIVTHQDHGDAFESIAARGTEALETRIRERSINRRLFYDLAGFCPEYGILSDGFGYE